MSTNEENIGGVGDAVGDDVTEDTLGDETSSDEAVADEILADEAAAELGADTELGDEAELADAELDDAAEPADDAWEDDEGPSAAERAEAVADAVAGEGGDNLAEDESQDGAVRMGNVAVASIDSVARARAAASAAAGGKSATADADQPFGEPETAAAAARERTYKAHYQPDPQPKKTIALVTIGLLGLLGWLVFTIIRPPVEPAYTVFGEGVSPEELAMRLEEEGPPELVEAAEDPAEASPEDRTALAQFMTGLIINDAVAHQAEEEGVEASQQDIDDEIDRIVEENFQGDQAAFDQAVESSGLPREGVEAQLRTQVLVQKLVEEGERAEEVTDEAIQAAYDQGYSSVSVSHILVASEEEAEDVVARLDDGEDFAEVAAEVSLDTGSAAQGGELGPFQPGMFVPEFEEAVNATEPGDISGPVESQFGWHVIKVDAPPELDDVREEIQTGLTSQAEQVAIQELVTELMEEAEVEVGEEYGEWVGLEQGGVIPPGEPPAFEIPAGEAEGAPAEEAPAEEAPAEEAPAEEAPVEEASE